MNYMLSPDEVTHTKDRFNSPFESGREYFCILKDGQYVYVPTDLIYDYLELDEVDDENSLYDYLDFKFKSWSIETCYPDYTPETGVK